MVCKPTLPVGSNTLESLFDFRAVSELDPTSYYDKSQLRTVNILNNVLLKNYDLTDYPNIKERIAIGTITDPEYAEFLLDSGLSLDFVQDVFINDFPVAVDYSLIETVVKQVVENRPVVNFTDPTGTPIITGTTPITGTGNTNTDIDLIIGDKNPTNLADLLDLLDIYYDKTLLSTNANICAALSNPFAKLISILATARDLAEGVKDLAGDINKLITDTKYQSLSGIIGDLSNKVLNFQKQLTAFVDSFAQSMMSKISAIGNTVKRMFETMAGIPEATYKFIQRKIQNVKLFFSKENLTNIKNNINKTLTGGIKQFEDVLPDVLNFLLMLICGMFDKLQLFMQQPVDELNGFVQNYKTTYTTTAGYSTQVRNQIRSTGATRVNPTNRVADSSSGRAFYNRANPSRNIPGDVTPSERGLLDQIGATGLSGYFIFGSNVQNMGQRSTDRFKSNPTNTQFKKYYDPDENFHSDLGTNGGIVDAGWANVNPGVWIRLIRTVKAAQNLGAISGPVTINSAYRSPFYNRIIVGGAKSSHHMTGDALDISFGNISNSGGEEFIRQASIFGFGGISYYPASDFTHFDVSSVRTWGANGKYTSVINTHVYNT